jgi:hypothetical protein
VNWQKYGRFRYCLGCDENIMEMWRFLEGGGAGPWQSLVLDNPGCIIRESERLATCTVSTSAGHAPYSFGLYFRPITGSCCRSRSFTSPTPIERGKPTAMMDNNPMDTYHVPISLNVLAGLFLAFGAACGMIVLGDIIWRRGWRSMMWIM